MHQRAVTLGQLWSVLGQGPLAASFEANKKIIAIVDPAQAAPDTIVFVASQEFLSKLIVEPKALYVLSQKLKIPELLEKNRNYLLVKDALLAMAKATPLFDQELPAQARIHSSAVIDSAASLDPSVEVGAFVSIGAGAQIGAGAILMDGCRIGANVQVGPGSRIFPNVVIYDRCILGANVRIHSNSVIGADGFGYSPELTSTGCQHVKIHHLGRVVIGDNVEIGASTTIDRGTLGDTKIGRGTKIDNQVQVAHNCQIGNDSIVCGSTGIAGSAQIGNNVVVAGFVAIGNGVKIGDGAMIAGFSMVFSDVPEKSRWGGFPARSLRESMKLHALVARLPELFKAYRLEKKQNET